MPNRPRMRQHAENCGWRLELHELTIAKYTTHTQVLSNESSHRLFFKSLHRHLAVATLRLISQISLSGLLTIFLTGGFLLQFLADRT